MNEKLTQLSPHFDSIFVHLHNKSWSASAERKFSAAISIDIRVRGHDSPEAAVDDLYSKVMEMKASGGLPVAIS